MPAAAAAATNDDAAMLATTMAGATTSSSSSRPLVSSPDGGGVGTNNRPSTGGTGADALARSNLLRLEASELLSESSLHVHPRGDSRVAHVEAKWAPDVRRYLDDVVTKAIKGLGRATLGPDVVALLPTPSSDGVGVGEARRYRVPLLSDKFSKSLRASGKNGDVNPLTSWTFPFGGGSTLALVPVGSFAHAGNAGLSNRHANGNVVPVLDVAVLVDGGSADGKSSDEGATFFVGGKDYSNHRYTDKRNILAVHVAKQLSQKKHRSKIGAVHLTRVFGDASKVGLILTPPLDDDDDDDAASSNDKKAQKKKRKRGGKEDGEKKKKKGGNGRNKLRFRIRLVFGVKRHDQLRAGHDDGSDDEEAEGGAADGWNCWIPRSRLLPDRGNNRLEKGGDDDDGLGPGGTPHYTNSLAEDLHLVSTSVLVSSVACSLSSVSGGGDPQHASSSAFHETLLLLKVWALQRGFLRGHDAFTTTTLAVVLAYLYRTKAIGRRMGCVQAFIAFMKFWSESDWLGVDGGDGDAYASGTGGGGAAAAAERERRLKRKAAHVVPKEGKSESQTVANCRQARLYLEDIRGRGDASRPKTLLECYKHCYTSSSPGRHVDSPVLLDPTMTLNYLARLSPSFVRESRAEARSALRYIHGQERNGGPAEGGGGAFRKLFLETKRFWTRYDAYVRVPLSAVPRMAGGGGSAGGGRKPRRRVGAGDAGDVSRTWGGDADDLGRDESVVRGVVGVLSRALGDRATAVRALTCGNGDIRSADGRANEGGEDVATRVIADSDQCFAAPIRGNNSSALGHAARVSEREPASPVLSPKANDSEPCLVVGLRLDPDSSRRIVDRGPPAEDVEGSDAFVSLWGERAAQLRRFQDGAIVRAVVWNGAGTAGEDELVQFYGMDRSMGGIAERIVRHVVKLHFTDPKVAKRKLKDGTKRPATPIVAFELRDMVSFIDGVATSSNKQSSSSSLPFSDSLTLHKSVMNAFDSLADFLRRNTKATVDYKSSSGKKASKLGLPLSIDEVEPLSPCLRYSELFPPVPHPLLGGSDLGGGDNRKVSGANVGSPILIQIRFEGSSKWPASLSAMGAAKCAMLIQLANGIEAMKQEGAGVGEDDLDAFDGPMDVVPTHLDLGYRGYSWRIMVRAGQELRMLRGLSNPTKEAMDLRLSLINRHVRGAMHHSLIHAVHTRHPSASSVVRLARRWVASHMLSDMLPHKALELMVAKIYTENLAPEAKASVSAKAAVPSVVDAPPSTVAAGFCNFLLLLSSHDWAREPLIVDPQNHISSHDRSLIRSQFEAIRGPELKNGPAMYIISPADYDGVEQMAGSKVVGEEDGAATAGAMANATEKVWAPTATAEFPERVVLSRAAVLALRSRDHLSACVADGKGMNGWAAAFLESPSSLTSYSALLRVDPSYVTDPGCSSTDADCAIGTRQSKKLLDNDKGQPSSPFERSLETRYGGPKVLRKKHYKNLVLEKDTLHTWQPVKDLVRALRLRYGDYAVFFYNEFAPDIIALIWRPDAFRPQPFSAVASEFKRPAAEFWKDDSPVITNTDDLMAEISYFTKDIISNFKVFDDKKPDDAPPAEEHSKKPRQSPVEESSGDSEEE